MAENFPYIPDALGLGRLAQTQMQIAQNRRADLQAMQQHEMNKVTLANARQQMLQRESDNVWRQGLTQHMQQMPQGVNPYLHQRQYAMQTGRMDFVNKLDDQQFQRIGDLMVIDPTTAVQVANDTIGMSQGLKFNPVKATGKWSNVMEAVDPKTQEKVFIGQRAGGAGFEEIPGFVPAEKAPGVSIKLGEGEKLYLKPVLDKMPAMEEQAMSDRSGIESIDTAVNVLEQYGDKVTGLSGSARRLFAPYAAALGINSEEMGAAELFKTITDKTAGSFRMEVVGPGPVSEFEQKILQQVSGGKMTYADGAKQLLRHYRDIKVKKIDLYNKKRSALGKQKGFESVLDLYSEIDVPVIDEKPQEGRTVVRRGTLNGRPVVKYSDGTTEYAD